MHKKLTQKIIFLFGLIISISAFAALDLELTQGVDSAIPIAVTAFAPSIHDVVVSDLKNSGRFRISDASNPNEWKQQKLEAAVTANVQELGGNQYSVAFQLHDVLNNTTLLDRKYTISGSQLRQLSHHISDLIYQQLTGDRGVFSTKIAYILVQRAAANMQQAKYTLEVADADGFNPKTLLSSDQPLMSPSWSPDGKYISYVSFEGNRAAIYQQSVATGAREIISKFPGINGAPAWSPDGRKLAIVLSQTGYPKIYLLDLTSKHLEQITNEWYLDTEPNWAPDGKSIIFTSNRGGSNPQIYRIYLNTKKIERVTFNGSYNARGSFASDGKSIAMLHQDGDLFSIAVQDLDSDRLTVLTKSGYDESPSIAPNGKMIVYATNFNGRGVLAVVSTDGRVKLMLPARQGEVQEPAWSPFLDSNKN